MNWGGASVAVALSLVAASARAAAPQACTESHEAAQVLRKQGRLLAARDQLRVCVQPACPGLIIGDCTQWMSDVQASLPSVVPVGLGESGANLGDVRVSIDGTPPVPASAVQAIDIDPGHHHFTFERDGSPSVETDVLVALGDKNKRIAVTLRAAPEPAVVAPPPPPSPAPRASRSPLWWAGIIAGGVGVAGVGVGAAFGAEAISKKSSADCPGNVCRVPPGSPATLHDAWDAGNVSTAFLIGGGVLTAAGLTTWLLAPASHSTQSGWIRPAAIPVARGGGLVVLGCF